MLRGQTVRPGSEITESESARGTMKHRSDTLLLAMDFAGTFVFAVEGGTAAAHGNLDLLGVMVLAFATALGGGILRDVLIGAVPPNSISNWRYGAIAFAGGFSVFLFHTFVQEIPASVLMVLDAAGLSLFAIAGAENRREEKRRGRPVQRRVNRD